MIIAGFNACEKQGLRSLETVRDVLEDHTIPRRETAGYQNVSNMTGTEELLGKTEHNVISNLILFKWQCNRDF